MVLLPEAKILFSTMAAVLSMLALWVAYVNVSVKQRFVLSREEIEALPDAPAIVADTGDAMSVAEPSAGDAPAPKDDEGKEDKDA